VFDHEQGQPMVLCSTTRWKAASGCRCQNVESDSGSSSSTLWDGARAGRPRPAGLSQWKYRHLLLAYGQAEQLEQTVDFFIFAFVVATWPADLPITPESTTFEADAMAEHQVIAHGHAHEQFRMLECASETELRSGLRVALVTSGRRAHVRPLGARARHHPKRVDLPAHWTTSPTMVRRHIDRHIGQRNQTTEVHRHAGAVSTGVVL